MKRPHEKTIALSSIVALLALIGLITAFPQLVSGQPIFKNKEVITVSAPASAQAQARLLAATKREFSIEAPERNYILKPKTLAGWLDEYYRSYTGAREFRPDGEKIQSFLTKLSQEVNQPAVNARLNVDEDGQLQEVSPPRAGRELNVLRSAANISAALMRGQSSTQLAIDEIQAQISLERAAGLGITTLLGRGESNFTGSPDSRIHNIKIGAGIFNGVILKPGEEFSFNQTLGPVDASTGYQPELVIKNKSLIPEYGGGLCQVSTTLFRAVATAGLSVLERHPHAIPVRYYNPQGFDATIYPGVSDFRFKNDTSSYILVQTKVSQATISFEIYGSSDGRKVAIDGPRQYDVQPDGSMKAILRRTVTLSDGTERKDVFRSWYKSPDLYPKVRNPLE